MILPLQLRHDPALDTTHAAWFLAGNSAARWLGELVRCGLAGTETRLFIVPRSIEDRTPIGLLVVPSRPDLVSHPPVGMACRRVGNSFFAPADAALHPPVNESELHRLAVAPVSFYHPVFGLSGFETESALHVHDLIEAPPIVTSTNWNFARAGAPALPELAAVVLIQPLSVDDIFGGAEEEIGSEPLADLPPAPDEPVDNALGKSRRGLRRMFAKGISDALRRLPHTGRRRTWLNDVEDWANRQLRAVSGDLEKLRHKELRRLLHLLDSDPEAGLRQAISMNSFAHRGAAPPEARLVSRSLEFNPGRIGGRPADFWNVPHHLQEVLRRRYREMADREMQLGRHRRAAYIYAELLGDLVSAANAFKQGRLFREAALLYEEHLRNPLEAARCLAEGGLLAEAIERYEKLGRWLDVADLQERAGNQAAAEQALRRVVAERLALHDILGAAKLVEERLREPETALQMLLGAWPSSHQAANCLGAAFQLLARLSKHEVALERLAQFKRETVPAPLTLPLLSTLVGAARDYPHEGVRHAAADLSRVLIARQLQRPGPSCEEAGRLLEHLVRLAPQDRLLSRDANRYLIERRNAEIRRIPVTRPPLPGNKPVEIRRFELPRQIQWVELRRELHWFFALGLTRKRLTLLRGVWEGEYQSLSWDCPEEMVQSGFVFEPTAEQGKAIALRCSGGELLAPRRFPASDLFFNRECIAGTPSWLPTQGYPFAFGEDAVWSVHLATGRAILSCYDKVRGQLQRTLDISDDLLSNATRSADTRLCLAAVGDLVAVALGNRLLWTTGEGCVKRMDLPGQVIRLCATIANTRRGVAVMLHHGAVICWAGAENYIELDRDIASPLIAFVPAGPLVLAFGSQIVLLDVDACGVHRGLRMEPAAQQIVGLSATGNPGEFAILNARGEMIVYRDSR
ncbi:MAG TPA: hypothetical protein VMA35_05215 [Candidatus Sulfopaludibacter sp.]|nr:hypothetical protein [Candidatus Sulfopaludibacter sp.]